MDREGKRGGLRNGYGSPLIPTVPDDDSLSSSWPDLFRPSTSLMLFGVQDVDARDKRGHDESITQGRWYDSPPMERHDGPEATKRLLATRQANAVIKPDHRMICVELERSEKKS